MNQQIRTSIKLYIISPNDQMLGNLTFKNWMDQEIPSSKSKTKDWKEDLCNSLQSIRDKADAPGGNSLDSRTKPGL